MVTEFYRMIWKVNVLHAENEPIMQTLLRKLRIVTVEN